MYLDGDICEITTVSPPAANNPVEMSEEDQELILSQHSEARGLCSASNMMAMVRSLAIFQALFHGHLVGSRFSKLIYCRIHQTQYNMYYPLNKFT